ncbi:1961_t:CDS:2 [Gigaspora margarita]|uniref:1961_t:CDS:1 n=1 Tax=Gigaspora margarita TaxID=4874 RepID=A0ABN7UHF2_GIGMA|nr:1961_t:CDS:2 [Gigaspora margarita]
MYRKTYAISAPCKTRWNSLFFMCTTLLRTQEALEIIGSSNFWEQIKDLVKLLTPYCKLLNMLQRDKARLFEVTFSMAYLLQFWKLNSDISLATKLIERLE